MKLPTAIVRVGDALYALSSYCRYGSAAEFIAIGAADLAPKPHSLNFDRAAAVPLASLTAWQALFWSWQIEIGGRVLIHRAVGGVGDVRSPACDPEEGGDDRYGFSQDPNFLGEAGVSLVIEYSHEHFGEKVKDVDLVLDTWAGKRSKGPGACFAAAAFASAL
jgi:NADPH:quinone reductase-like Zn-dependent oxidoreductase